MDEQMRVSEALRRRAEALDGEGDQAAGYALVVWYEDGTVGTEYGGDKLRALGATAHLRRRCEERGNHG